jgi:peptide-methionine (S)-S-oxide reductase
MLNGVQDVVVGYAGGTVKNPTYEAVSMGTTGHAEVARVSFDPSAVSYKELLDVFFYIHDPTQLNRQGADIGPQYRSVIFYENDEQKRAAEAAKKEAQEGSKEKVVTEIVPLEHFWPAEEYHQRYFEKNPDAAYCQVVVAPKVERFKKTFTNLIQKGNP